MLKKLFFWNIVFHLNFYRFEGKTNKEFNMRHDWNSLINDNDDLLMTKYSKEFFPAADDIVIR